MADKFPVAPPPGGSDISDNQDDDSDDEDDGKDVAASIAAVGETVSANATPGGSISLYWLVLGLRKAISFENCTV